MQNLTMSDIGNYLNASRAYIENAKDSLWKIGYCCPSNVLGDLIAEQDRLDRMYYQATQGSNSLGVLPIVYGAWLAGGAIVAYIGSLVYTHYTDVKVQSDRYKCISENKQMYINSGISEVDATAMAVSVCEGNVESTKSEIIGTLKTAIYGGVVIFGLYILNKFIDKK